LQLEVLRKDNALVSSERAARTIDRLHRSYGRLAGLVDSFLEQSKIHAGRMPLHLKPVDLAHAVMEVVEELRPEAERRGLRLMVSNQAAQYVLATDAKFLHMILANLIGNAVKFTDRGAIDVGISSNGTEYRIAVRDDGPGILAEDQRRIFEPFERVEPAENKHTSGFGLGLATSRKLSEALGARIELASQVGSGSTFTLVLPSEAPSGS